MPAGLSLNTATGAIRGVPTSAGVFALTFAVKDAGGQTASVPASIRIVAKLAVTTSRLRAASLGETYRARIAASGGLTPKRWRIVRGELPRGLRIDAATGLVTGVAREAGTFRIVVQVTDRLGARSTKTLRLTVTG